MQYIENDPLLSFNELLQATSMKTLHGANEKYHELIVKKETIEPRVDLTDVYLPVGIVSADQSAILGRDGHFFLLNGTNRLIYEYSADRDDPTIIERASRWTKLFEEEAVLFGKPKYSVCTDYISEKMTALPELVPLSIAVPTATLSLVEEGVSSSERLKACYFSGRHALQQNWSPEPTFLKADSHFTPYGTWLVFKALMSDLGLDVGVQPEFDRTRATFGDLSANSLRSAF